MNFSENVDEIVALIMAVAGVAILIGGMIGICLALCELAVEDILLLGNALLLPSTGYLFGKAMPKQDTTMKDAIIMQAHRKE